LIRAEIPTRIFSRVGGKVDAPVMVLVDPLRYPSVRTEIADGVYPKTDRRNWLAFTTSL
jgi:hypothetical protein